MKIAIIGAGLTGLTAGYRLSKQNHQVTIFEKEKFCGGLAAGFREPGWDWPLEKFYHHLFTSDNDIKKLLHELDLSKKLFCQKAKTSIYFKDTSDGGRQARSARHDSSEVNVLEFDSPLSLLRFSPLSFPDRLRTGLVTAYLKLLSNWQPLEQITAYSWLQRYYGEKVFQTLWEPLLVGKFGKDALTIPMSWFWARIKKRSASLGYLEGGFQTLIDKLQQEIKKNGGEIHLETDFTLERVARAEGVPSSERSPQTSTSDGTSKRQDPRVLKNFDKIIVTTSPQIFFPELPSPKMLGALNLILTLKKPFLTDGTYWLNINDPSFPFVAVVEHTNLVNPKHYGGNYLLYVGGYYPQNHRYFQMSKEEILAEFLPFLQKINPQFKKILHTKYFILNTNLYAQPIIPLNYSKSILPHFLQLPQAQRSTTVYLANMSQVYPWDRGTNYAIELGEKIARICQS